MRLGPAVVSSVLLLIGAIAPGAAQTPSPAPAEEHSKIAVISFQEAVAATNEFQRELAALQKKFEPRQTELKTLTGEIENLTKQLQADGAKLTEADRESRARTIDNKKKQAQRLADDDQNDFNQEIQELANRVAQKVGDVLTAYAKDHGFTLVIDRSEQQQGMPVVLYASPATDIGKQIIEAYNAKSGVPAPTAALPAAPSPSASK